MGNRDEKKYREIPTTSNKNYTYFYNYLNVKFMAVENADNVLLVCLV